MNLKYHWRQCVIIFLVLMGAQLVTAAPRPTCGTYNGTGPRLEVCEETNELRAFARRPSLVLDTSLSAVAQRHAHDMQARGYFSHRSPEGGTMASRLASGGVRFGRAGENIAVGQRTAEEVVEAWWHSEGHRRNMMGSSYRRLGVGRAGNYWVMVLTD